MGQQAVLFGAQDAPQPLRLLLPRAKGAGNLDGHVDVGQIYRKVGHLGNDQPPEFALADLVKELLPLAHGRLAGDERCTDGLGDLAQLIQVGAHDEHRVLAVFDQQLPDDLELVRVFSRNAELVPLLGQGVDHAKFVRQRHTNFVALGGGDPALPLQVFPGHVVLFGANERKDVGLAAVLADEGGGEAQSPPGLDLGGDAKDRRRQQVDFVVDDQSPVALVEQLEMRKVVGTTLTVGEDLVGGDGHRPDLFDQARVFANVVG